MVQRPGWQSAVHRRIFTLVEGISEIVRPVARFKENYLYGDEQCAGIVLREGLDCRCPRIGVIDMQGAFGRTRMTFVTRARAEPLRMAALAFLFGATMLAAIVVMHQTRAALNTPVTDVTAAACRIAHHCASGHQP